MNAIFIIIFLAVLMHLLLKIAFETGIASFKITLRVLIGIMLNR